MFTSQIYHKSEQIHHTTKMYANYLELCNIYNNAEQPSILFFTKY